MKSKRILCDTMLKVADDIMLHISLIMKTFDEKWSGKEHRFWVEYYFYDWKTEPQENSWN